MEIRLLGPLELVRDGTVVPVPGASERALLALLATAPGRTFSKGQLIDALWGAALPANPHNALQIRVSKLRRVLGPALVTRAPGYALDIDPTAVDAVRFEQLLARGRATDALALWRGTPFAELDDHEWADAERRRLEELHATAIEEDIDARLANGDHVRLVAELEALVAASPLRERLRSQLMVALYRCGRAPEALAAYTELRDALDEELGVEPSPALRQLQADILREDPALDAPASRPPSMWNLPSIRTAVLGRARLLAQVGELLGDAQLVTLTGPGGVGKTTLALESAREQAQRHADGVAFVPLTRVRDGRGIPDAVAEAVGVTDPDSSSTRRLVTAWLSTRRALLVMDNCEHLADACAVFIDELLSAARGGLRIIATSREALGVPGEMQVPVPPLAEDQAVQLFVQRARGVRPDFPHDEDDPDVRRICQRLDGLPLAIELAAARVNTLAPEEIAARLDDRFSLLTTGPRTAEARQQTLHATVEWSHALLGPDEQVLFRRLAVFQGGWTLPAAEQVCADTDAHRTLDLLGRLVDRSLVVAERGRFRMLETIRAYAAGRLEESGDAATTAERHAHVFTDLAEQAEAHLRGPEQRTWMERLRAEDANLRLALVWARQHRDEDPDLALRLAGALGWYWYVGRQAEGREYLAEIIDDAPGASDVATARALQAQSLLLRPVGCIVHPDQDAAVAAQRSAALFEAHGEDGRAAISTLLMAVEGVAAPDPVPAMDAVRAAKDVLEAHGDRWGASLADFVAMEIGLHHGDVDQALSLGHAASEAFADLDDAWGRSAVLLHLGYGLRVAGRIPEAEEVLGRAAALSREGGFPNNLARALSELGEAGVHRGDADAADRWFDGCAQVAAELANDTLTALAALGRGGSALLRGDGRTAEERFSEALELSSRGDFSRGVSRARAGLVAARLTVDPGAVSAAEVSEALEVAQAVGDRQLESTLRTYPPAGARGAGASHPAA